MSAATHLAAGFADPVHDSQRSFRALLDALARPGRIHRLPELPETVAGLSPAAAAVALALLDFDTPVWLDPASREAERFLRFHCGCPVTHDPAAAHFAFARGFDALPELDAFNPGSELVPEDSTTLVVEVADLYGEGPLLLSGPGIERQHRLGAEGLDETRLARRAALAERFPCGLDLFLTCGERIVGIPRTTRIHTLRSEPCTSR